MNKINIIINAYDAKLNDRRKTNQVDQNLIWIMSRVGITED